MLEFKSLENRIKQIELELGDRGELNNSVKSLILDTRGTVALLKSQYNLLIQKYYQGER